MIIIHTIYCKIIVTFINFLVNKRCTGCADRNQEMRRFIINNMIDILKSKSSSSKSISSVDNKPSHFLVSVSTSSASFIDEKINESHYDFAINCVNDYHYPIHELYVCRYRIENHPIAKKFGWTHWILKAKNDNHLLTLQLSCPQKGENAFFFDCETASSASAQDFFKYYALNPKNGKWIPKDLEIIGTFSLRNQYKYFNDFTEGMKQFYYENGQKYNSIDANCQRFVFDLLTNILCLDDSKQIYKTYMKEYQNVFEQLDSRADQIRYEKSIKSISDDEINSKEMKIEEEIPQNEQIQTDSHEM